MSPKTSTAALDSFGEGRLANRRRAPRHPAGGRRGSNEAKKQRSNEKTREAREFGQARIAVREEEVVNGNSADGMAGKIRVILPAILRITFSLVLWTLGAKTMTLPEAQMEKQGVSQEIPSIDARLEFH